MSHAAPIVTTEHMQRAYAQLRRPDWPTFEDMQRLAIQFAIVRSRACDLANGRPLPPEPTGAPARALAAPSARANGQTERRRRDDHLPAVDFKSRAAGERDDD